MAGWNTFADEQVTVRHDDHVRTDDLLRAAHRMHVLAQLTGEAKDYTLAAELFEKVGKDYEAMLCREAADLAAQ